MNISEDKAEAACEAIDDLIAELEAAKAMLEDEDYECALEEIECQVGTIGTILRGLK